jgi:hypothetical protein
VRLRVAIALSALALTLGLPFHASTLLAQYQPPSEKLLITAGSAATWAGDGEDVIQLEGPVTIETDRARLSAQRAVIWLRPAPQAGLPPGPGDRPAVPLGTQRAEILLIGDAQVEHAGALRTGPRMAVTAEVAGEVRITAQERRAIDLSNSPLYQQALELRRAALPAAGPASQPTAGPATRPAGTDEDAPPPPPKVEPVRLIFKQMDTQYVVDGKVAPLVTGGITLMQRRDNGDFIELQAERAVIFTTLDKPSDASRLGEAKNIEEAVSGVYLEGDVRIVFTPANPTTGEQRFRARRIFYDFTADRAVLTDAVIHTIEPEMQIPVVIRARMVRQLSLGEFKARNVELSTSSFALPSYSVAAESVYVRKVESTDPGLGDRLVFRADNATFRMFGVPVFWLPRAGGSLTDRGLPLRSAALQNSSTYGASVRTTWGLFETLGQPPPEDLDVEYALDYLGDRGIAGGIDADYEGGFVTETTRQRWAFEGELDSYFVNDRGIDTFGRLPTPVIDVNPDPAIEDLRVDRPDSEFRGQALWKHQHFFPGDWQLQVRAGYVSDPTFLETYFRRDFNQGDPHDVSFYLKRQRDTEAATFLTSVQPNNVVTTADLMQERFEVERLPEFGYRRIGDGFAADDGGPFRGMTLVSTNTVSGLRFNRSTASLRELGFSDTLGPGLPSLGRTGVTGDTTYRGDFRQEVSFPVSLGQFRFLPYLVGRYTGYSDAPGGGEEHRLYSAVGARVSTAFWKVDEGVESRMFDLHRMRHVVEPELNVYASGTNVDWSELFIYDEPVDSIHDVSAVSLALRQRWQTERGAPGRRRSVDFLALNVEGNFFANEDEDLLPPQQFRGLYFASLPEASVPRESVNADLTWRLGDTTVALADAQYNLDENELATLGVGMIVTRDERLSYFLSSRYINVTDSNVAGIAATYELSRKYTVIVSQSYDFGQSENVVSGIEVRRRFDTFFLSVAASQSKVDEESSFSINFYPTWLAVPALDAGQFRNVFGGPRRRR